ncbi:MULTISPECIES: energy-coupling factor ABC transporter ATP-binding protein [Oceanobacillus]|uniref:Energy-coupling factor transporter ATP-binding protein EcfA2 n=1 Tax=Oceanobacillus kimchii TaxID=746691 RepID=A0ABQ5TGV0_9BACI|nr:MULTISPECIES: energy-coupling factor ABC transporter ATP-binding protein [Oceanobacillus]MBT2601295.1 energy-coupling factor ABC transporter ATP-binding protein [Oceanobacillus sp. ISL-74]MBT2653358.1 energy-coupling factor ABC transporter ATP-binding protein [Oceanobacillus sp. ISL-73]MCT1579164.1 energy-coupling factor ABC transporter ATP-binding protein [Oceanobacillus kimchii]MCT2137965.1 energy-coupling factor ABC transporter ATP-binding protein [Oceanobacillus kimchii]OEH53163.1 energ
MDISFKNVSYIYQENTPFEHRAIEDLNFTIESGSFVAIIGHTGSGKSTLIQHLNGLTIPSRGEVRVGDFVLNQEGKPKDIRNLRSKVGVVFQYPEHQLFEETVYKDIAFGPQNFGVNEQEIKKRIASILPSVGLPDSVLERSPFDLSGGQKRRVAIAGVLAMKPKVLVLDEPTAGLDPRGQKEMMNMFNDIHQKQNLTTIFVTHNMEDALKYADKVIILNKGKKFMEGKPLEVLRQRENLQQVQLDTPEVIDFIDKYNHRFNDNLVYQNESIVDIAAEMKRRLEGGRHE